MLRRSRFELQRLLRCPFAIASILSWSVVACGLSSATEPTGVDADGGIDSEGSLGAEAGESGAASGPGHGSGDSAVPPDGAVTDASAEPRDAPVIDRVAPDGSGLSPFDANPLDTAAMVVRDGAGNDSAVGDAGADGDSGDCVGGWTGEPSTSAQARTPVSGYGNVTLSIPIAAQIVGLSTILTVPAKPPASGTLFLWPGLQPLPGGKNFDPIGNGVLQPVLTWGGTCAPNSPAQPFASWWISAQYVNTYASYMGHAGCNGGPGMNVAVGDALAITMRLTGTVWNQVVIDTRTGEQVSYDIDMLGQAQDWVLFMIESYAQKPVSDVVFTSTRIVVSSPQSSGCQPSARGQSDYFATPSASRDGLTCCISRIILRAQGVPATTPDVP